MTLARIALRSIPNPRHLLTERLWREITCRAKPPLYPSYDRAYALNLVTRELYTQYLQKRRHMAHRKVPTRVPLRVERRTPAQEAPYAKLLTPHTDTARLTRIEKVFEKSSAARNQNIGTREEPPNFLGGLMYKARVGPKQLIRRQGPERSVLNGPKNGANCGNQADKRVVSGPTCHPAPRSTRSVSDVRRGTRSCSASEFKNTQSDAANIDSSARANNFVPAARDRPASAPHGRGPHGAIPRRVAGKRRGAPPSQPSKKHRVSVDHVTRDPGKPNLPVEGLSSVTPFTTRRVQPPPTSANSAVSRPAKKHRAAGTSVPAKRKSSTKNSTRVASSFVANASPPVSNHRVHSVSIEPSVSVKNLTRATKLGRRIAQPTTSSTKKTVSRPIKKQGVDINSAAKEKPSAVKNVTKGTPSGKHDAKAVPQKTVSLPLKKRCIDDTANVGASGRKEIETIDVSKLANTKVSRRTAPVMESPVSVTQSPFIVSELKLTKPAKQAPTPNRVRRGLSFERRPRDCSKPVLYIADPREEDKLRSAYEAAHVKTLEEQYVRDDERVDERASQHSPSHNWEITFA